MKLLGSTLSWLLHVLIRRWFLLFTLFALYYYHVVLNKDILCSCSVSTVCPVYLMVPALLLFVVQLWVDLAFSRGLRLWCQGFKGQVTPVLIWRVLEAGFVGLLWVHSVLLDGDWYLCCGPYNLYCYNTPTEEQLRDTKNESLVIGLLLVVLVTLLAAIMSCIPFEKRCSSDWPEAALAEAGLVISQQMRTVTRDQLRTKLDQSGANEIRKWEGLEKDLLLDPEPAETPRVQDTVHVNPLPLSPIQRHETDMDLNRL